MKAARMQSTFVAIVQCCFVTVMAIGDDQFVFFHCGLDRGGAFRIGDDAQPVNNAKFVI